MLSLAYEPLNAHLFSFVSSLFGRCHLYPRLGQKVHAWSAVLSESIRDGGLFSSLLGNPTDF